MSSSESARRPSQRPAPSPSRPPFAPLPAAANRRSSARSANPGEVPFTAFTTRESSERVCGPARGASHPRPQPRPRQRAGGAVPTPRPTPCNSPGSLRLQQPIGRQDPPQTPLERSVTLDLDHELGLTGVARASPAPTHVRPAVERPVGSPVAATPRRGAVRAVGWRRPPRRRGRSRCAGSAARRVQRPAVADPAAGCRDRAIGLIPRAIRSVIRSSIRPAVGSALPVPARLAPPARSPHARRRTRPRGAPPSPPRSPPSSLGGSPGRAPRRHLLRLPRRFRCAGPR
jgi:hypothetical protein